MKSDIKKFLIERTYRIARYGKDKKLQNAGKNFMRESVRALYTYNFEWLGLPIIQYPQDIVAMQEIIWKVKPDFIIETGIARGGSVIFYASMMKLLGRGKVVGIDIDIRPHNKKAIQKHPLYPFIKLIEGSSVAEKTLEKVKKAVKGAKKILVVLDSLHTHEHVLRELQEYCKFVSKGSYIVVFDTVIENLPSKYFRQKPWNVGNNPKTAVNMFLQNNKNFIADKEIDNKLLITVAPGGYLKKIK